MKFTTILAAMFFCLKGYSQNSYQYAAQTWNYSLSKIIKAENIKRDSVFVYGKRKNNKDSMLIMTDFFDTSGYLVEKDQYSPTKELERIINYTYSDSVLLQQETINRSVFRNGSNFSKKIRDYYYDSIGNNIIVEENSYIGDSLKNGSVSIFKREYDSMRNLINEFRTLPQGQVLYHSWVYSNGKLREFKTYNQNQTLINWYLNEYDDKQNRKTVYDMNKGKTLTQEYFYDNYNRVIMEKDYESPQINKHDYLSHTTLTFQYNSKGLVAGETFQDTNGEYAYIKVIYSK
jgi:hypothetical protein